MGYWGDERQAHCPCGSYVFLFFRVALRVVFSRANFSWEPNASLIACIRSASLRTLAAYASGSTFFFFMSHSMTQIWIQSTNASSQVAAPAYRDQDFKTETLARD